MNRLNQISQVNQMNPDVLQQLGFGEGEVSALNTGFGFIQRPNFPDLFFHFSEWPRPQDQIAIGTKIRFECGMYVQKSKLTFQIFIAICLIYKIWIFLCVIL